MYLNIFYSYYQVVCIQLDPDRSVTESSSSYGAELSGYESANIAYIAAEFSSSQFEANKDFVLGDGKTYSRFDSSKRKRRSATEYVNVNLDSNYKYSMFYRSAMEDVSFSRPSYSRVGGLF